MSIDTRGGADFADAMRIIGLITTMPEREHTFVPTADLRTLARVIMAQCEDIASLTSCAAANATPLPERDRHA